MTVPTANQKNLLLAIKSGSLAPETFDLVIREDHKSLARLVPVVADMADDTTIVSDLMSWRKDHMAMFATQFPVSSDRTAGYIRDVAGAGDDRILFLVELMDGKRLGHFGLCNINKESAELDNLIRGVEGGAVGLFAQVELALLDIAFRLLGVNKVFARVLSFNRAVVGMHRMLGLKVVSKTPVVPVKKGSDIIYETVETHEGEKAEDTMVLLSIDQESYFKKYNHI